MAWTAPKTWTDGSVLTAAELNEQLRDNLNFLKAPADVINNGVVGYSTTSTTFVDIHNTNLSASITTSASASVLCWFQFPVFGNAAAAGPTMIGFNINVDGSNVTAASWGVARLAVNPAANADQYEGDMYKFVTVIRQLNALTAGSHTIKLQWRVDTGTAYIGPNNQVNYQFGVREIT